MNQGIRRFRAGPMIFKIFIAVLNTLNAELNSICHLLSLFGAHHILYVSRIRVNPYPANVENKVSS
jgi:hypothetical protein